MGVLPVDAIFNPVKKVNYAIERTRVGHVTDYERLVLEMWTDGTITPIDALKKSSDVLVNHFFLFSNLGNEAKGGVDRPSITVSPEIYQTPIEKLELTPRTLNCLKRAYVSKVGQVLEMSNSELLKIRNFGEKSLEELLTKLGAKGMLSEEDAAARLPGHGTNGGAQEGVEVFQTASEVDDDSLLAAQFEVDDDKPIWDDEGGNDDEDDLVTLYDAKLDSPFRQNREEN